MNVNFQTANKGGVAATTEWYTPHYIIESLGGKFDFRSMRTGFGMAYSTQVLH